MMSLIQWRCVTGEPKRSAGSRRHSVLSQSLLAGALGVALVACGGVEAQAVGDVRAPSSPLVLSKRGSFFVSGHSKFETSTELTPPVSREHTDPGHVTVDQMYVEFMVPQAVRGVPVVMFHGGNLSGKSYDTTPDGRMGWYEYFVRKGHPTYVADQVGRARSGVDVALYNDVRAGLAPPSDLKFAFRLSDEMGWSLFRFGPSPGVAFPDTRYPIQSVGKLSPQSVPDWNATLPDPNPTIRAMSDIATQLNGAVLLAHSESGPMPIMAAVKDNNGIRGMVIVETGSCLSSQLDDQQVAKLRNVPMLVVFGDHLQTPNNERFSWQNAYDDCQDLIKRVNAAGGSAKMFHPPDIGIHGNSHMIMQDTNNLQIADFILKWLDQNVPKSTRPR